jgi:DNA-binding Lrp family transcriptional regulator|tara:strand:- start:174 stop:407 length:234 start_codon:yes stop_codon:yes gene_type:complete
MPIAFVLINAELDSEKYIIEQLNKIECVTNVDSVYGVYDLVIKIESNTMDEVKNIISYNVRRINHVRSTLTMIVIEN